MVLRRGEGDVVADTFFSNLTEYVLPGDLLVVNDTKVSALRLVCQRESGAPAEIFLTTQVAPHEWEALVRPGRHLRAGARVRCGADLWVDVKSVVHEHGMRIVSLSSDSGADPDEVAKTVGLTPLPPYIHLSDDENRQVRERYQTVYAEHSGSAAAPTAGLHFTDRLLAKLVAKGVIIAHVTLHVGLGTFRPISTEVIEDHIMHEEVYSVPEETAEAIYDVSRRGGRVIAVGTTVLRALESAATAPKHVRTGPGRTTLFLKPGDDFQVVDALITNFHMPRSTLLVLVCAFMGMREALGVYAEALGRDYRFLSFGDAMLILPASN